MILGDTGLAQHTSINVVSSHHLIKLHKPKIIKGFKDSTHLAKVLMSDDF